MSARCLDDFCQMKHFVSGVQLLRFFCFSVFLKRKILRNEEMFGRNKGIKKFFTK